MISISGISKTFFDKSGKTLALDNVSLNVAAGEIFGVIGQSGAGKSSLLRCINLLERPDSGTVTVNTLNLTVMSESELRAARRHIGMIFQNFNLLSSKSVAENIAFPLELLKIDSNAIKARVKKLLKLVGLTDKTNAYPENLSGGQKQRVAIARALASNPKVLLCDEATSALDPRTTESILQLLKKINEQTKITIVLITHEMDVIKAICSRACVLDKGKVVEMGEVVDVFTNPKSPITRDFVQKSLKKELPHSFMRRLHTSYTPDCVPVIRITFRGSVASKPIVARLIQDFKLNVNIIQANIELISNETIGVMIIELSGENNTIKTGLAFLQNNQLNVEIIGYVARNLNSA